MRHPTPPREPLDITPLAHTVKQAAQRIGIGESMLYRLIDKHQIQAIRIGRRVVVAETELQRYIAAQMSQ